MPKTHDLTLFISFFFIHLNNKINKHKQNHAFPFRFIRELKITSIWIQQYNIIKFKFGLNWNFINVFIYIIEIFLLLKRINFYPNKNKFEYI